MPLPLLPAVAVALAQPLAELAGEGIASLFSDDKADQKLAGQAARNLVGVASKIAGLNITEPEDAAAAVAVIKNDPAMLLEFQRLAHEDAVALLTAETARLQIVNSTIQAEVASSDPYVRRMRPTWGYVMAGTWASTMGAVTYTIVTAPAEAARILSALADTTMLWGIGLGVLGVYVSGRTKEKTGVGMLDGLLRTRNER